MLFSVNRLYTKYSIDHGGIMMNNFNLASDVIKEAKAQTKRWRIACIVATAGWIVTAVKLLM